MRNMYTAYVYLITVQSQTYRIVVQRHIDHLIQHSSGREFERLHREEGTGNQIQRRISGEAHVGRKSHNDHRDDAPKCFGLDDLHHLRQYRKLQESRYDVDNGKELYEGGIN